MKGPRIGFDYRIHYDDMEMAAAIWTQEGQITPTRLQSEMGHILGTGSRKKAITVLSRLWTRPLWGDNPGRGLLLDMLATDRRLAYWGLLMVAYPFACQGASDISRLLTVQEQISARHVHKAVAARLGESEKVRVATWKLLVTLSDWGMLTRPGRGLYRKALPHPVNGSVGAAFLTYCALAVEEVSRLTLTDIERLAWLFPFQIRLSARAYDAIPEFSVESNGPHDLKVGLVTH